MIPTNSRKTCGYLMDFISGVFVMWELKLFFEKLTTIEIYQDTVGDDIVKLNLSWI